MEKGMFPSKQEIVYRDLIILQIRRWMENKNVTYSEVLRRLADEGCHMLAPEFAKKMKLLGGEITDAFDEEHRKTIAHDFMHQFTAVQYILLKKIIGPQSSGFKIDEELCVDMSGEDRLVVNTNEIFF